jgi:anthraniloyl-CoA monooxygenase
MRIAVLGGGPAGLYFALLMKQANPAHDITTFDRNAADNTFGWGIVFSDKTMEGFRKEDPKVVAEIEANFRHWDDIDVHFKGRKITSGGHGFCGIARLKLQEIFQKRCAELGVKMVWKQEFSDPDEYAKQYDLVVGADGVFSTVRKKHEEHFNPRIDLRTCRFIWLGTRKKLDAFTFAFRETPHGWFNLHAYRFNDEMSTFIVETPEPTWYRAGLDKLEPHESVAFCEKLFADLLDGNPLISNARHLRGSAVWLKFNRVLCERWFKDNIVLIGDAAHTAHFAIGSGTKLAMEDAISLVKVLNSTDGSVPERLARYQAEREIEALKLQSAARNRMTWFEDIERYTYMEPEQLAFSLLTASQRVGHANLKLRDPKYVEGVDAWFARKCGVSKRVPPMFTPFALRDLRLPNRVVVAPMCTYSAVDGMPGDFHFQHYAARALGGAGLVMTEMTCVAPDARITPACTGIWNDAQQAAWKRIVDFVRASGGARLGLQIGHAGRKGATNIAWEGIDQPLAEGAWPLVAPSPVPYFADRSQTPRAMMRADMDRVKEQFVAATRRALAAGFDLVEFHAAHGYLNTAAASRTAAAIRSRCSARCAPRGPPNGRCPCASRRTTGCPAASRRPTRRRSRDCSARPAPTSSTSRPAR